MIPLPVAVALSYVLGSIPAAYVAGRLNGIDLRKHGSGNLGATNVMRVLGTKIGLAVFAFDMAKGAVPVVFFPRWTTPGVIGQIPHSGLTLIGLLCGVAAIFGHARPLFLRFSKGGKGVATAAGVFLALAPTHTLLSLAVFIVVVLVSGYVSLGSLIAAALLPVLLFLTQGAESLLAWVSVLVAAFVYWTHRANIGRLRRGEEHRFGKVGVPTQRKSAATAAIAVAILIAVAIAARMGTA
jgi:glycerol-3-phosphate acyltransferase PlsY